MILLAEKGRATVVLDKAEYKEKVLRMLSDGKTHEQLKNDPTASYKRKIVAILTRLKLEAKLVTIYTSVSTYVGEDYSTILPS